jgi:hypothetical protein
MSDPEKPNLGHFRHSPCFSIRQQIAQTSLFELKIVSISDRRFSETQVVSTLDQGTQEEVFRQHSVHTKYIQKTLIGDFSEYLLVIILNI